MHHKESTASKDYQAYLLRLWRVREVQGEVWHASLETVGSGERCGFPDLQDLFAFLRQECKTPQGTPPIE